MKLNRNDEALVEALEVEAPVCVSDVYMIEFMEATGLTCGEIEDLHGDWVDFKAHPWKYLRELGWLTVS